MPQIEMINNMSDFLEYTQIIKLLQDQMEYIGSPKTNEQIMSIFKLAFASEHAKLMGISESGHMIGFIFFNISIGMESAGKYVWINEMHIHKEYRNKGYGTMLFAALRSWCEEQGIVRIMGMADDSEQRTLDFYRKQQCVSYSQEIFSLYLNK